MLTTDESSRGLRALRFAATLADVVPFARLRIRARDNVLLYVGRGGAGFHDAPTCDPDVFRTSVAGLYRSSRRGSPLNLLELLGVDSSTIDVGLRREDRGLPGGIYRLHSGSLHMHLFMSTLPPLLCRQALTGSSDGHRLGGPPKTVLCDGWLNGIGLHFDPLTEVTVVHAYSGQRDSEGSYLVMQHILEALVVAETLSEMAAASQRLPI